MGFFDSLIEGVTNYRGRGGVTNNELEDIAFRTPFSKFIPWHAYDPESCLYANSDGSLGYLFECSPIVFASEKTLQVSEALLRLALPPYSVLQFLFHADPNINPILRGYERRRDMSNPLIAESVKNFKAHLLRATNGSPQMSGIPLRDMKLLVSLKFPADDEKINRSEVFSIMRESLSAMGLAPRVMTPGRLLDWSRRLFNSEVPDTVVDGERLSERYDEYVPINKQIISAETVIERKFDYIQIGKNYWRCITPKSLPSKVDPLQTKELFGGIWGVRSDNDQHKCRFMFAYNIVYDNLNSSLRTKCDTVLQQGAAGSWARSLQRKQEESKWCVDKFELGETFCHIMPVMWVYADDVQKLEDSASRAKRIFESPGYYVQEDKDVLLSALFVTSLPFGLRANKDSLNMLARTLTQPGDVACNMLPIQGGFAGSGEEVLIFTSREGQCCCFDIFSKSANNYNGYVAASTGAGKSFAVNYIAGNQYFAGTLIRIIDIGGSYEKMADMTGGRYLDFKKDSDICINPFSNIVDPEEDLAAIALIVLQAVYSSSENPVISEEEQTLAKNAVEWAYEKAGSRANFDLVFEYLDTYPKHYNGGRSIDVVTGMAHKMAFNIKEFTSQGRYGALFNGTATFDIANDKFLVLELEALKQKKDLFKVVTLMILDAVTRDLYLSDRSQKRMVIFDEAWQFLSDGGTNTMLRDMIESGYRRARKYHGSFFVITQSLLDRQRFGAVGDIIWANADYKFLLQSPDYEKARSQKLIDYDDFSVELLKTVASNKPKYSEIFLDTPFGAGVVRLAVDDYSYYLYTSAPDEVSEMKQLVAGGMSWEEAIYEMVRRHRT